MSVRVCHVASNHNVTDGRVFKRESKSLAKKYNVSLIVPNVQSDVIEGINVIGVELPSQRLKRMIGLKPIKEAAMKVDADIYHFHDPELLPIAKEIKKLGKKVIFDSHEDVPADILEKPYIPLYLRKLISCIYEKYEKSVFRNLDALVTVTPKIVERLKKINPRTYLITNYPIYKEIEQKNERKKQICFTGLISHLWKQDKIVESLEGLDVQYVMAGPMTPDYQSNLEKIEGWKKVNYRGIVSADSAQEIQTQSIAGMALLGYSPIVGGKEGTLGNTKLFEYMMAGTPVIASDLNLWKAIVSKYDCGICVCPDNTEEIAKAIRFMLENPDIVEKMGANGQRAVKAEYNWATQESVLFDLYEEVLSL